MARTELSALTRIASRSFSEPSTVSTRRPVALVKNFSSTAKGRQIRSRLFSSPAVTSMLATSTGSSPLAIRRISGIDSNPESARLMSTWSLHTSLTSAETRSATTRTAMRSMGVSARSGVGPSTRAEGLPPKRRSTRK